MNDHVLTPDEIKILRRMISDDEKDRGKKNQDKARKLTKELRAKYGPRVSEPEDSV